MRAVDSMVSCHIVFPAGVVYVPPDTMLRYVGSDGAMWEVTAKELFRSAKSVIKSKENAVERKLVRSQRAARLDAERQKVIESHVCAWCGTQIECRKTFCSDQCRTLAGGFRSENEARRLCELPELSKEQYKGELK
jgi:hypothetical protein